MAILDRQKGESARSHASLVLYCELGPQRSLAAVARKNGKHISLLTRWSSKWQWVARARAFDEERDGERRKTARKLAAEQERELARRAAGIREDGLALAEAAIKKAGEIMKCPLHRHETKDGKTVLTPASWSVKDGIKIAETAVKLGLSLTGGVDDSRDFRDERFEYVDFPPEDEEK